VPRKPKIIEITKILVPGGSFLGSDFILFDDGDVAWAISRHCTHLGCTVNFHEKDKIIECPCHQSRFSIEGEVLHGPAKKNLSRYKVERLEKGTGYLITI
jgi:Rieske Fe-S protein